MATQNLLTQEEIAVSVEADRAKTVAVLSFMMAWVNRPEDARIEEADRLQKIMEDDPSNTELELSVQALEKLDLELGTVGVLNNLLFQQLASAENLEKWARRLTNYVGPLQRPPNLVQN